MAAFKATKEHSILIFIDTTNKEELQRLSPLICGALRNPNMGNTVPKLIITNVDETSVIVKMPYQRLASPSTYPIIKQRVEKFLAGELPTADPDTLPVWHHQGGFSQYFGHFHGLIDGKTLQLKINVEGKIAEISLNTLSVGAQNYAKILSIKK